MPGDGPRRLSQTVVLSCLSLASSLGAQQASVEGRIRNGGAPLPNAAVYLIPVEVSVATMPDPSPTIDQSHLTFIPEVLVITPGTAVEFVNSDPQLHNVFGPGFGGLERFDLGTYDRGDTRTHTFIDEGVHVVLCHVHPEMAAYVLVAATPYKAVTDREGTFYIESVPPGRYVLHAWHRRRRKEETIREITVPSTGVAGLTVTLGTQRERRPERRRAP